MTENSKYLMVLSTCPDAMTAKEIAKALVDKHIAACVQIVSGIQSFFYWDGKVDNADEHLMLIKTTAECYKDLESCIKSMHPYELPEIVAVPISTGSSEYLSWLDECTLSP